MEKFNEKLNVLLAILILSAKTIFVRRERFPGSPLEPLLYTRMLLQKFRGGQDVRYNYDFKLGGYAPCLPVADPMVFSIFTLKLVENISI